MQIIFPGSTVGRKNDLYLFCCSAGHKVAPCGRYLAFVSTNVEGSVEGMSHTSVAHRELEAGLKLLMPCVKIFYSMYDMLVPTNSGEASKVFISQSFDPTSHFETAITDVTAMYKRITGTDLVLSDGPQD